MRRRRWGVDEKPECLVDQGMVCRRTLASATVVVAHGAVATFLVNDKGKELRACLAAKM